MDKQNILSQELKEMNPTQNLSTPNQLSQKVLDSNQKSVPKSSSSITKEQEEQNFDILNEENYEDVNQLSKEEDIEGIQNLENSQSDEKEFSKNNKSHLVSQMNEEEESENQNLNQENLLGAKKQGEDLSIPQSFHSDLTLKKKIKSSFNRNLAKSEFFQNGTFQVFNNKEVQNAIITYKNEENNICHQYQSTAFISKDNSKQQIIHDQDSQTQTIRKGKQNIFEKKLSDKQQQQDKQQNNSKIFANQIIEDKKNSNDFELPDKSNQDKQENKETIFKSMSKSDQPQPETSTLLENQGSAKQLEIEKQFAINIKNEENNICHQYQSTDQDSQTQTIRKGKQNTFEKKLSDKQQQQDQQQNNSKILLENQSSAKQLEIEKQLAIKYASQIQEIANKIEEFQINENELDQSKFENINESQIQSKAFQDQKAKIFQKLIENNFQPRKILISDDKQTLVLCSQKQLASELTDQNKKEIISFIYHNPTQSELVCLNQIFNTLLIKFDIIQIEQDNISILIVQIKDFESLNLEKFKLLIKFEQSIYLIKDYYYVIDSTHFPQNCQNCENYQCFQNIKARIIAFLQFKKHFYCEYSSQISDELIFKLSKEEIITFYINFVYRLIFRFLDNESYQIQKTPDQQNQQEPKQINNPQILT
ncbi:hypothetical protein ABPG73_022717, partial [Tetrahymena malaccensis]